MTYTALDLAMAACVDDDRGAFEGACSGQANYVLERAIGIVLEQLERKPGDVWLMTGLDRLQRIRNDRTMKET